METTKEIASKPAKALPDCPVETTLTLISDKWKVLILRDLLPGSSSPCRIHTDRAWLQSQAHFGCYVGLGRRLQS